LRLNAINIPFGRSPCLASKIQTDLKLSPVKLSAFAFDPHEVQTTANPVLGKLWAIKIHPLPSTPIARRKIDAFPVYKSMERLAHAPLTRSGFTSFVVLQLFEVVVTADFLNNPQPYSGVAHRSLSGRCDGSCGSRLPRCRLARTLFSKSCPRSSGRKCFQW